MSQYDRGSQRGGSEHPLSFEPRRPVRSSGPAPVTLVLSLLLLVVIGGGVFFLYRGGVRGPNDAPQPVGVPIGDLRSPAPAQPQSVDPAAGLSIYKDSSNAPDTGPAFAPPPEQPLASAAKPPPPSAVAATPAAKAATAAPGATKAVVSTTTPPAAPTHPGPTAAPTPTPKETAAATALMATPADAPKAPAASGKAMVQIGAYSSASQADAGWNSAAGVAPAAMAGKGKKVETVAHGAATLYRTSITGFASRKEAQALCDKLQAAGKTCFVK
ncbi:MAG TPA: SPOR domain-containing protein [Caulobacteraceae bacterium]